MAKAKSAAQQPATEPAPLVWPSLPPPPRPLRLDSPADGLVLIDSFFSLKTRTAFVSALSALRLQGPSPPKKGEATRTNDRFSVHDPAFAQRLWTDTGLADALQQLEGRNGRRARGLNPNIRCYRYSEGAFFNPHYDDDVHDPKTGWTTEWTLLVYLTGKEDGVVGASPLPLALLASLRDLALTLSPSLARRRRDGLLPDAVQARQRPCDRARAAVGTSTAASARAALRLARGVRPSFTRSPLSFNPDDPSLARSRRVEKGVKWVLRSDVFFG